MNPEQISSSSKSKIPKGCQIIFDDTEENFVYRALKGSDTKEIARKKLIEFIESGKPVPLLEIRTRN